MLEKYPKISIITPSLNQSQYLEETIISVISQNYPNLEYIIIDGGSTDGSVGIIKKYEKHLAYWISEPDNGMYEAIQKGFEKSSGEIMGWINSDDKYHPFSFFSLAEIFSSFGQVNWLTGCSTAFDEKGRNIDVEEPKRWSKFDFYTNNFMWIQQESTFWRRNLWEKAGGKLNVNLKFAGDFELWLRFFKYDKLVVASILIGGFRNRSSNQLSLNHMKEYLSEIENCLVNEALSEKESKIVNKYYQICRIIRLLQKTKFIRTDWILKRFINKYYALPPKVVFNRYTQKFELSN